MGARTQLQRFLAEVGRFLLVGGAATIASLVVFNLLAHGLLGPAPLGAHPITAFVVANTIGMLVSFQGSRSFAFKDRQASGADGGFTAYVAINLATMLIPIACLSLSRNVLGLDDALSDNVAANVVGLVLGLAARFSLFRTFVFKRPIHLTEIYDEHAGVSGGLPASSQSAPSAQSALTPTVTSTGGRVSPPSAGAAAG